MERTIWSLALLGLLLCSVGCGGRSQILSPDTRPAADGAAADGAAAASCTGLGLAGKVSLEYADTNKMSPRVVFDGEQFSVVWHTQPAPVSSLTGELRLARVDTSGAAKSTTGTVLGKDNGAVPHALAATAGELALVHWQVSSTGSPGVERRLMDPQGVTRNSVLITGKYYHAALALHPKGHALLLAGSGGVPRITIVDRLGARSDAANLITAQVMASLWLAPRSGGFAAMLHSTNSNATLHLFDQGFTAQGEKGIGHGSIKSPSMAVLPDGFGALYTTSSARVEVVVHDVSGKETGHSTLATASWSKGATGHTALTWTGKQLVAVYPSSVPGQYLLHLLGSNGEPVASATPLPNCLAVASTISAAWGNNRLAVATVNSASGVAQSSICVTVMKCL